MVSKAVLLTGARTCQNYGRRTSDEKPYPKRHLGAGGQVPREAGRKGKIPEKTALWHRFPALPASLAQAGLEPRGRASPDARAGAIDPPLSA